MHPELLAALARERQRDVARAAEHACRHDAPTPRATKRAAITRRVRHGAGWLLIDVGVRLAATGPDGGRLPTR